MSCLLAAAATLSVDRCATRSCLFLADPPRCRADNSEEVVATVLPGSEGGDLSGLDLHALASTDLPEHTAAHPSVEHAHGGTQEAVDCVHDAGP